MNGGIIKYPSFVLYGLCPRCGLLFLDCDVAYQVILVSG